MDAYPAAVGGTQSDPGETQHNLDELAGSVSARPAVGGGPFLGHWSRLLQFPDPVAGKGSQGSLRGR